MQYLNNPQEDLIQLVNQGGVVAFGINSTGGFQVVPQPITASGVVSPFNANTYVITSVGIAALTLAAPIATVDDGNEIVIFSATNYAHTLTATGLLGTGTASVNKATFAAFAGASITLMAYQGKWLVLASVGVTFS